jgi:hypothetical protein
MTRIVCAALFATATLLLPAAASAQGDCPEGRTARGPCANVPLARGMQKNAMIFSQPRISSQAFALVPADDFSFRYPHQLIPNQQMPAGAGTLVGSGSRGTP